jgi:hypothetical protein
VPYTLDANDMRFATASGFANGTQFFEYLRDTFDVLYAEGAERPKMMSIGMHCRLLGRPAGLRRCSAFSIKSGATTASGSAGAPTSRATGSSGIRTRGAHERILRSSHPGRASSSAATRSPA